MESSSSSCSSDVIQPERIRYVVRGDDVEKLSLPSEVVRRIDHMNRRPPVNDAVLLNRLVQQPNRRTYDEVQPEPTDESSSQRPPKRQRYAIDDVLDEIPRTGLPSQVRRRVGQLSQHPPVPESVLFQRLSDQQRADFVFRSRDAEWGAELIGPRKTKWEFVVGGVDLSP